MSHSGREEEESAPARCAEIDSNGQVCMNNNTNTYRISHYPMRAEIPPLVRPRPAMGRITRSGSDPVEIPQGRLAEGGILLQTERRGIAIARCEDPADGQGVQEQP
ncbi:hypothetical protein J6590_004639 [Homalodisca vitripennis]|nr:hypothetical protein J6590_004639 [Homalodisca vitripennis]